MRASTLLTAALLAFTSTATAATAKLEVYPDSENCSGRVVILEGEGCHPLESRGSARVIAGGAWGTVNKDCTGFRGGAYKVEHGCFSTYPVWYSWSIFDI